MSLEAEREMWEAVASQPAPASELAWRDGAKGRECVSNAARRRPAACDRCGRELGTGLPSPCSRCAPAGMSRAELDSLTVFRGDELEEGGAPAGTVELWSCSGLVGTFVDRDAAYAEVRRLRGVA